MLTREEILNEKDLQQINVWVAQYVFGRKYPTVEEMQKEAERVWKEQPNCRYFHKGFEAWEEDGEFKWNYSARDYSSDISAAFEMEESIPEDKRMLYGAMLINQCGSNGYELAHAKPEQRCRAALLAVIES